MKISEAAGITLVLCLCTGLVSFIGLGLWWLNKTVPIVEAGTIFVGLCMLIWGVGNLIEWWKGRRP